ncbi:MAG: 50S ribosomal L9 C-terminal domain-containing protein, partial [Pseudomonadota bacterium]|nr:50S ribosomal L9 C-terminal domain-containing protein [Pseudomonadota bacterium]
TVREIADKVTEMGVEIDRSEVRLPDGPLRNVGEYEVEIALHIGVHANLKVIVEAEESFPS